MLFIKGLLATITIIVMTIIEQRRQSRITRGQEVLPAYIYWLGFTLLALAAVYSIYAIVAWK